MLALIQTKESMNPDNSSQNNPQDEPDISTHPEAIEEAAAQDAQVEIGGARVQLTDDPQEGETAQSETIIEPVEEDGVPKAGMHLHHAQSADELFDCTIIGGGPTGLYGAFYAGMREMSVKIIDSLGELGGQVSALYPEKYIYDVAGFEKIKGKDLIAGCIEQGLQFGPTVCLGEKVEMLQRDADGNYLLTTNKSTHRTKTIIIAAGVGAFAPRKLPKSDELNPDLLDDLEGSCVFYFVKELDTFKDKNLLIVGGGDSAMDWAMGLEPLAKNITLIHRRDKWRAHEDSVRKVLESSVNVQTFHEVKSVNLAQNDSGGAIRNVTIFNNKTKDETQLDVDILIMCLGFIANIGPIKEWNLQIAEGGIAVDPGTMQTNLPGIYAAGDIARFQGKLNLIATGFGEAATAANYAKNYVDPTSKAFPGHSSEKSE
jgi:thioredoxin reductase (NADPH)